MTKQFTIPCQFGQQTSPVTFYIGHPDNGHHPIHFQSDWLSSAKGGTVPQDLMMALQKLHDLALENNADFEELCYYALISATQNADDDGVSQEMITDYADQYLKKEFEGLNDDIEQQSSGLKDKENVGRNANNKNNSSNLNHVASDAQHDNVNISKTDKEKKIVPKLANDAIETTTVKPANTLKEDRSIDDEFNEGLLDSDLHDNDLMCDYVTKEDIVKEDNSEFGNDYNNFDDALLDDEIIFDDNDLNDNNSEESGHETVGNHDSLINDNLDNKNKASVAQTNNDEDNYDLVFDDDLMDIKR